MGTKPAAGQPQAKLILSMITLYVDGEACCFVSITALAEDCELSPDTIWRRLAWLESLGLITRTPQWLDSPRPAQQHRAGQTHQRSNSAVDARS
jgi:DeoR/GlpR family transcriptional regulator of sugar metabolism